MYILPFLSSFIIMSSTIMLLPVLLCPASAPINNSVTIYDTPFTLQYANPPVTLHNSSTSSPG